MINPKERAELDQNVATAAETLPLLMKALYDGFIREGFNMFQALELCKTYLASLFKNKE